ncbi:MAG: metabolite traffic protein EboE [Armatimonadetes bacterium]|nr:metabolite traffic protein EboE [Armatimonadota bacterium]
MQLERPAPLHLTYCTNIHPGDGWEEVFANLRHYAPALKERLSPGRPFGIGLRLSSRESEELLAGDRLARFKDYLDRHGLYVFALNGFPYGSFHRQVVKSAVFAPDWREEERVRYTLCLVEILKRLLPEGVEGGISTTPLSYKRWIGRDTRSAWERITRNLARIAGTLVRVQQEEGRYLHLDIEPEPDGLVENSAELVNFYETRLLPCGAPVLADALNVPIEQARQYLLDHVQICYDTCHMAVEYENPETALERFARARIKVGRLQISAALQVPLPADEGGRAPLAQQLAPFAESVYLHQVIERVADGNLRRYPDLPDALTHLQELAARQWRIHFHVPLFTERYGPFGATQDHIRAVFALLGRTAFTRHLEIETYTWDVLPLGLKGELLESIEREYRWVLDALDEKDCGGVPDM